MSNKETFEKPVKIGKHIEMLMQFIASVKSGKKSMIVGIDYVVMSRNYYETVLRTSKALKNIDSGGFIVDYLTDEEETKL